ncbi:MAG: T9SS type A sorting domain-containing protein [Bacteroidota bacterium]
METKTMMMVGRFFCLLTFLWHTATVNAQVFEANILTLNTSEERLLRGQYDNFTAFDLDLQSFNTFLKSANGRQSFELRIGTNDVWQMRLDENEVRSPNYKLTVDYGNQMVEYPRGACDTYKGQLTGGDVGTVRIYVSEYRMRGMIRQNGRIYEITPLDDILGPTRAGSWVLTRREDLSGSNANGNCSASWLEIALEADYAFYLQEPMNNVASIKSKMESDVYHAMEVFDNYFTVLPIFVHANVRTTPDNYGSSTTQHFNTVNNYYNANFSCLNKDFIYLFRGGNVANGLANKAVCNTDDLLNNRVPVPSVEANIGVLPIAHEIGHTLGQVELENVSQCSCLCDLNCGPQGPPQGDASPLMCTFGINTDWTLLSPCTIDRIQNKLDNNCDDCLAFPEPQLECLNCALSNSITVDNPNPVLQIPNLECTLTGSDEVTYTVNVKKDCNPGPMTVRIEFPMNRLQVDLASNPFSDPAVDGGELFMELTETFQADETKTYTFSGNILSNTSFGVKVETTTPFGLEESMVVVVKPISFQDISPDPPATFIRLDKLRQLGDICGPNDFSCNRNVRFSGVLRVDQDFTLKDYIFSMEPGAKIDIRPGTHLTLENCHFYACDGMWEGFEVNGPSSFSGVGKLTVINSILEDAEIAINALPESQLCITNTTFNCNRIGIEADASEFIDFSGNTFQCDETLLPPYQGQRPFSGMVLTDILQMNVFGPAAGSGEAPMLFKGLQNGIYAFDSNLDVRRVQFEDIDAAGNPFFGYGINASGSGSSLTFEGFGAAASDEAAFLNCDRGISCDRMNVALHDARFEGVGKGVWVKNAQGRQVDIDDNYLQVADYGILLQNCTPLGQTGQVGDNTILLQGNDPEGFGIFATEAGPTTAERSWRIHHNSIQLEGGRYGIRVLNTHFAKVQFNDLSITTPQGNYSGIRATASPNIFVNCNELHGDGIGTDQAPQASGIFIEDCLTSQINCNTVAATPIGIQFLGHCEQSRLRGNVFYTHMNGLLLGQHPANGDAWISDQPHHGNRWLGQYIAGVAARHLGSQTIVDESTFFYDGAEDFAFNPLVVDAAPGWFVYQPLPSPSFECSSTTTCLENQQKTLDLPNELSTPLTSELGGDIELFPNPVRQQLHIRFLDASKQAETIQLSNQLGQQLQLKVSKDELQVMSLDVGQLPVGLYLLNVQYADGTRTTRKVIVVH